MAQAEKAVGNKYISLSGRKPEPSVVAAGNCQFVDQWESVKLLKKQLVNHNTALFTFETPDKEKALGLSTCACILVKNGDLIRPYTPISTNAMIGQFELLIKHYPNGADGKGPQMSAFFWGMPEGTKLEFKHIKFNVKTQYPFNRDSITMLVGGTGITPMIQALHPILGNENDKTQVTIFYGSRTQDDILGKDLLDQWEKSYEQLKVNHVLSHEPEDSDWQGLKGFITADMLTKHGATPKEGHTVWVCGPPPMYNALCGPRGEKEKLTGALADMGFTAADVYKF